MSKSSLPVAVEVVDKEGGVKLRANGKLVGREQEVQGKLNLILKFFRKSI